MQTQTTPSLIRELTQNQSWADNTEMEPPIPIGNISTPTLRPTYSQVTRQLQEAQPQKQQTASINQSNVRFQSPIPQTCSAQASMAAPFLQPQTPLSVSVEPQYSQYMNITKDTKVISLEVLFVIFHHVMSFIIHRRGPPVMEDIVHFIHSIV